MRDARWVGVVVAMAMWAGWARAATSAAAPGPATQRAQVFERQITVKLDYLLYLPGEYGKEPGKKWPLILFLHGAGERGSDVDKVRVHGPPKLAYAGKDLPFVIVSPQCPANAWWKAHELIALLDDVQAKYAVDADRVYLTGLSMGGYGTWELASQAPQRFAAIAPICGAGNPVMARRMRNLPTWVFHGDADTAVPVERGDEMVEAMKKAGAPELKYTRYAGVGHDSWTKSYDNPELFEWFLAHKRTDRPQTRPAR